MYIVIICNIYPTLWCCFDEYDLRGCQFGAVLPAGRDGLVLSAPWPAPASKHK